MATNMIIALYESSPLYCTKINTSTTQFEAV